MAHRLTRAQQAARDDALQELRTMLMNITKPADFADLLATSATDIQNRKKRLFRALSKAPNLRGV